MSSDGAVTDRIADAEQSKSLIDLIIIKKALIGLVHRTAGDLAGTGGAGTSTTGIGKINTGFFGRIQDVNVVVAGKACAVLKADGERSHGATRDLKVW